MNLRLAIAPTAFGLFACGAMPNPAPPVRPAPETRTSPASSPAGSPASSPVRSPESTPGSDAAPAPAASQVPPSVLPAPGSQLPIARVAGREIDVSELLRLWLHQDSLQVLESLDHLVIGRLVLAEAARLSLAVDPARAEKAYQDAVAAIEKTLGAKRPGVTLDQYVDEALGLDPVRYREYLRDESLRGLLAERVVRCWLLGSERTDIRVIVVRNEEDSRKVTEALAAGEAFEEVARKLSADASAKDGGLVPPVVRGDTPISRLAFASEVGQIGGPQYEKGAWLFVKVVARPQVVAGDWKDVQAEVEKSLAERPVADLEVSQWKPVMAARYGVDISPLLDMAGQRTH